MVPESFDVRDQMVGRVRAQLNPGVAGMGRAAPTSALIERDDAVHGRIEGPSHSRYASRPGTAMQEQCRSAIRIAAGIPVDPLPIAHVEKARRVRLDRWIHVPLFLLA